MKGLLKSLAVAFLVLCSCEEEVDIIGPLDEKYVLSCIVGATKTIHYAYLTKSYEVDLQESGNDASYIKNASLKLRENNVDYYFRDTTIYKDGENSEPIDCYVLSDYSPQPDTYLILICELQNGEVLTAKTRTSPDEYFNFSNFTQSIPTEGWEEGYGFRLEFGDAFRLDDDYQYFPSLKVYYTKKREGDAIRYVQEIPNYLVEVNGKSINHYPQNIPFPFVDYHIEALEKGLMDICEEGYGPDEYKLVSTEFTLYLTDQYFSKYFMSNVLIESSVNKLVTKPYFSNIEGGLGIFASYSQTKRSCWLKSEFVNELGFRRGN